MKGLNELPQINYVFWLLQTIAMMLTGWVVPGFKVVSPIGAVLMVVALAFFNAHVWDAALFFEIPDSLTSRTLTLLVANGVIFWVLVKLLPYIEISGCISAIIAPLTFTFFSIGIGYANEHVDWVKAYEAALAFIQALKNSLSQTKGTESHSFLLLNILV